MFHDTRMDNYLRFLFPGKLPHISRISSLLNFNKTFIVQRHTFIVQRDIYIRPMCGGILRGQVAIQMQLSPAAGL